MHVLHIFFINIRNLWKLKKGKLSQPSHQPSNSPTLKLNHLPILLPTNHPHTKKYVSKSRNTNYKPNANILSVSKKSKRESVEPLRVLSQWLMESSLKIPPPLFKTLKNLSIWTYPSAFIRRWINKNSIRVAYAKIHTFLYRKQWKFLVLGNSVLSIFL